MTRTYTKQELEIASVRLCDVMPKGTPPTAGGEILDRARSLEEREIFRALLFLTRMLAEANKSLSDVYSIRYEFLGGNQYRLDIDWEDSPSN